MAAGHGSSDTRDRWSEVGFGTRFIHQGQEPDSRTGAVTPAVSLASTYAQPTPGAPVGVSDPTSLGKGFEYSRTGNPTRGALELALAGTEKARYCVAFSSGMAAITAVAHILPPKSHVICFDDVYGGTQRLFRKTSAPHWGMTFSFVDLTDVAAVRAAFEEKPDTAALWVEGPTNPLLKVADYAALAELAHEFGAKLVVDNTFATPFNTNPFDFGADIVMHSGTKYIGGHSDVVIGCVMVNDEEMYDGLKFIQNGIGAVPGPLDCYLALRGLKTLHLRMERHNANALAIAKELEKHPKVISVAYPGLESHPQHEVAKKQMRGFGGMVTLRVKGGLEGARKFLENLKIFVLAESLGAVESLAESPAIMTHASVAPEHRAAIGIFDDLVRLSVGVEDLADLQRDIESALATIPAEE